MPRLVQTFRCACLQPGAAHTADVDVSTNQIKIVDREACDLLLTISNQSYLDDPVVLTVVIDGVEVLSRPFEVRNQHNFVPFPLCVGPGAHKVWVSTDTDVALEEEFVLPPTGERQYASIEYFNYADEDGKLIDWFIQSIPMGTK